MVIEDQSPIHKQFTEFKDFLSKMTAAMERSINRTHPEVFTPGSQFKEFEILSKLLPEYNGTYVDVGAGEPIECSNTWEFYKKGWRGLLIECLPERWPALLRHRPGDFLSPFAASSEWGFVTLRINNSLSSIKSDWDIPDTSPELIVECNTLKNILRNYQSIRDSCSLLSIDVEGAEKDVLLGIDWKTFHPKVIIIEAFKYCSSKPEESKFVNSEWEEILLSNGYCLHHKGILNFIYVRS